MLAGRKAFASVILRGRSRLSPSHVSRAAIHTSTIFQHSKPKNHLLSDLNRPSTSEEIFATQKSNFLTSNTRKVPILKSEGIFSESPIQHSWSRSEKRTAKRLRSALRIVSSARTILRLAGLRARYYSTGDQNSSGSQGSTSGHKSEKYSEFLRRRLGVWRQTFRRFFGAGQPFTLDKFLPVFNLMFVAIATSVLIGTTSIISLIVWIVNRNERWRELFAEHLSKTLTYQTGINITFDKAQGSWKEGLIKLHRVSVVRDPKTFEPGRSRNVTAMSLEIDEVSVKVSLLWFLQGKGWLRELNATGVKGTIDQRHLEWSGPAAPRRTWQRGDLFLDNMTLTNVEISLFKPKPDREMKISLHLLDCAKLRQQFLLYDILQARSAYGIFDGSLFSLKQSYSDDERIRSILKIDGIKTDLITSSAVGPLSWITEGTMDLEAELVFDSDEAEEAFENYYRNDQNVATAEYHVEPSEPLALRTSIRLNNLRASMPVTPPELSLISYALVRPVVAYMNTNYTSIPLNFDVFIDKRNFDGAWSPWEAGLFDAMSIAVAKEFLELIKEQKRPSNLPRHLVTVIKSMQRGIAFVLSQMHGYYELWYFNNDDQQGHVSFTHIQPAGPPRYIAAATAAAAAVEV